MRLRLVCAALASLAWLSASLTGQTPSPSLATSPLGERLYTLGLSTAGAPVAATVQGDVHVTSTEMTCVNCHRRSGMGTTEASVVVPPILGSVLFAPVTVGASQMGTLRTTGPGTRPAYTDETLLRALRDGVDPAGRSLSPTMPRYAVTGADARAIGAYLRTVGAQAPLGVDETTVHVATILTPTVSPARRASMLDVLRAFVRAKNGGSRYETRRRENGPWDMKQHYQGYRDWVLDEWDLHGAPTEWTAQLEDLYRKQPVYAIVSGITDEDWSPIDAFSASHRIPTILPQTPLPPDRPAGDGFYSLYFSKGVTLEARRLAEHLTAATPAARVRQVARCGTPGEAAAGALTAAFMPRTIAAACLPPSTMITADTWGTLVGDADAVVLWLGPNDMAAIQALANSSAITSVTTLYLSATLLGEDASRLPAPVAARGLLVDPFVAPDAFAKHAARSLAWMKANGITPADRGVAVNALFAVVLAADALSIPRTLGSQEYFVERIEHMAGVSVSPSAYPSVTFGAARRFGSAGAGLLKLPTAPGEPFGAVEAWSIPK